MTMGKDKWSMIDELYKTVPQFVQGLRDDQGYTDIKIFLDGGHCSPDAIETFQRRKAD